MKNIEKFITTYGQSIADACAGTGLFPSVAMAQLIQESSGENGEFGLSGLAYKYHNYGGIKYWLGYTGKYVALKTGEQTKGGVSYTVTAKFCVFESVGDFFKWRTVFLKKNPVYAKNKVFDAVTPYDQVFALKKAGYATDVKYVERVYAHILNNRLQRLDLLLKKKV